MPWRLSGDACEYDRHVRALLAARPVQNTLALTVLDGVLAGRRFSADPMVFGWYDDAAGEVTGAVAMTPPFELLLAVVPDASVTGLVAALRGVGAHLPGVNGDPGVVEVFAAAWTAGTGLTVRTGMRQRLYRLTDLQHPVPAPPGRARAAGEVDVDLAVRWFEAFQADAGAHQTDVAAVVGDRVADGGIWLWEDATGAPVSLAGRQRPAAGVTRVGPVYTPPEHRRRGYGTAVTAACTADAVRCGAEGVVLFTDLDNPTSNVIYQKIGYRPVVDRTVVRFVR